MQQRKREREAQREARWKRMHDPNLTMDDILGPPKQPAEPDKKIVAFELFTWPCFSMHVQLSWQTAYFSLFVAVDMQFKSLYSY